MHRTALMLLLISLASSAPGQTVRPTYPEGQAVPRSLTPAERAWLALHPLRAPHGPRDTQPPSGPVRCPAEYEPMEGILLAWESFTPVLTSMAREITTKGDAGVYVVVDTSGEKTSAESALSAGGVDMARVNFIVQGTDTVWIRDYGPRYIYEGNCRAIVDHTYNRPRPKDDAFPIAFGAYKHHAVYTIPLIHGGGNFHLDARGNSFVTRLVNNENPDLSEGQIHDLWKSFQNVDTTFFEPFPTSVDSTQHLDMWLQVASDDTIAVSDWPSQPGSTQDRICDDAASALASRGYHVFRVPAVLSGGVHYTYTNVVICNDLVMIPSYTKSDVAPLNDQALAAWRDALPGKTIVQINGQTVVGSAGVLHCIAMHVPVPLGGANPTAYVRSPNGGETYNPGDAADILWITDDDKAVTSVDILLSTDGGATFPAIIASAEPDDGAFAWTVPDLGTSAARIRVVVHDADGNTGSDDSDADFTIAGGCGPDCTGDGKLTINDFICFQSEWRRKTAYGDYDRSGSYTVNDFIRFQADFARGCK